MRGLVAHQLQTEFQHLLVGHPAEVAENHELRALAHGDVSGLRGRQLGRQRCGRPGDALPCRLHAVFGKDADAGGLLELVGQQQIDGAGRGGAVEGIDRLCGGGQHD